MKANIHPSIIVAILPFYGYIAAYSYEVGYFSALNLPPQLAQVRIESLVSFTGYLIFVVFIVVGFLSYIDPFYKDRSKHHIARDLIRLSYIPVILIAVAIYFEIPEFERGIPFAIGLFAIGWITYFVFPLFKYRKMKKSYSEKLLLFAKRSAERKNKSDSSEKSFFFSSDLFRVFSILALTVYGTLIVANILGESAGQKSKEFMVFSYKDSEYAFIRSYGNEKIGIKIVDGKLTKEYLLLNNDNEINFVLRNVAK